MSKISLNRQLSRENRERLADLPEDEVNLEADIDEFIPTPPDGGWGWVVVLASFMNHFILDGIAYAFGSYMLEYSNYFNSSAAATSALMSTLLGCYMLSAPVASALVNKYGCRVVGIIGSCLASVSFILCTFSTSIPVMIILFGVCGGIGFGFMYLPSVVIVSMYFEKKRPLAIGIAMCGTGVGTFTFGPTAKVLLEHLDWKDSHFVLAACILQGCIFSSLMRPLRSKHEIQAAREKRKDPNSFKSSKSTLKSTNGALKSSEKINMQNLKSPGTHRRGAAARASQSQRSLHAGSITVYRSSTKLGESQHRFGTKLTAEEADDLKRPMYKKDVFYSGSIYNIKEFKEHPDVKEFVASITSIPAMREQTDQAKAFKCSCLPRQCGDILAEMLNFSLFKNVAFIIISLLSMLVMLAYFIPFAYTSVRAVNLGVEEGKASFLISILGLSTTIGRPIACALAQIPRVRPLIIHNVCVAVAGLACVFVPFCKSFISMAAMAFIYGLSIGGHVSLSPILMLDYMGLDKLTTAYGLVTLVRGISTLAGPPIAGSMYDTFHTYDISFYMAGGILIICCAGFCTLSLKCVRDKYSTVEKA